jgi:hypothetical protein
MIFTVPVGQVPVTVMPSPPITTSVWTAERLSPISYRYAVTVGSGRTVTAAAAGMIPAPAWHRMRTGSGTTGSRHHDWAMLEVTSDDTPEGAR